MSENYLEVDRFKVNLKIIHENKELMPTNKLNIDTHTLTSQWKTKRIALRKGKK